MIPPQGPPPASYNVEESEKWFFSTGTNGKKFGILLFFLFIICFVLFNWIFVVYCRGTRAFSSQSRRPKRKPDVYPAPDQYQRKQILPHVTWTTSFGPIDEEEGIQRNRFHNSIFPKSETPGFFVCVLVTPIIMLKESL